MSCFRSIIWARTVCFARVEVILCFWSGLPKESRKLDLRTKRMFLLISLPDELYVCSLQNMPMCCWHAHTSLNVTKFDYRVEPKKVGTSCREICKCLLSPKYSGDTRHSVIGVSRHSKIVRGMSHVVNVRNVISSLRTQTGTRLKQRQSAYAAHFPGQVRKEAQEGGEGGNDQRLLF